MATTVTGTKNGAKRNLLGNAGIRYVGLVSAFIGLVILLLGRNITSTILQVASIVFVLVGLLLFVSNLKKLFADKKEKDIVLYVLIGALCLVVGVLLYMFGGTIAKWIDIILGVLIAIYGLACLVYYCIHQKRNTHRLFGGCNTLFSTQNVDPFIRIHFFCSFKTKTGIQM